MADVLFSNTTGYDYTMQAAYESYLHNKIDNENRLADMIEESLILTETSTTYTMKKQKLRSLYEAKLGDSAKSKWNRFLDFIKSLFSKFMESLTKILLNEQEYLKKYEDIILKKRGKSDLKFSYSGDYEKGIQRIIDVTVPMFDYDKYKDALSKEGDGALLKAIVPNVDYDEDDGVATTMKNYFIAADAGEKDDVGFDTINFTNLYNFCFDFKKIKAITEKDIRFLEQSTNNINKAIQDAIKERDNAAKTTDNANGAENEDNNITVDDAVAALKKHLDGNKQSEGGAELWLINSKYKNVDKIEFIGKAKAQGLIESYLMEEDLGKLKIEKDASNKVSTHAGSYNSKDDKGDGENSAARNSNLAATKDSDSTEVNNAVDKWIRVCRDIITAKWTASESIAKDYMEIIRAHVRSYVGRTDDSGDNVTKKQGNKYSYQGNGNDNTGNKDVRDAAAKKKAAEEAESAEDKK